MLFSIVQGIDSVVEVDTHQFHRSSLENDSILDIGATQHMPFQKDYFWNYRNIKLNQIYLGDDTIHIP